MTRVAVTGAAGWIGARVVAALRARGDDVLAVVRPGGRPAPPGVASAPFVRDPEALATRLAGVDAVVHLAAHYVRDHQPDDVAPLLDAQVGAGGALLEALRLAGHPPLVAADTWFAWAPATPHDDAPVNLYGATRRAFGALLDWYVAAHEQRAVRLVVHDVYGEDDPRPRLVPTLLRALDGGPPARLVHHGVQLDLVWADDVARAFVVALDAVRAGRPDAPAWAVRSGTPLTPLEVAERLARVAGRPVPLQPEPWPAPARAPRPPCPCPDLPGWEPRVDLDEGLRRLVTPRP